MNLFRKYEENIRKSIKWDGKTLKNKFVWEQLNLTSQVQKVRINKSKKFVQCFEFEL